MANFKEQYLSGNISIDKLDDFVDEWHKNKSSDTLQEYLGFNDDEYAAFVQGETVLKNMLDSQKKKAASVLKALSKIME